ncbi:MAG: transketolase family protein [Candidatus Uhrbacteria bacterium]|nr:transketolase family protein [Candidatus Uhrbacteria bacterium]
MSINREAKLVRAPFADNLAARPTRDGFGEGLIEAGRVNESIVVLCADLTESTRTEGFKKAFPDRFVQMGVSEQSLAAIAAGMALAGKTPFIASYAAFSPGRNWEQVRTTIALSETNVKIVGAHAGVSVGPDGATHQMTEDIAIMRVLPNMTVLVPCDAIESKKATIAAANMHGPVYIRFAREKSPVFTTEASPFAIGKARVFMDGDDVAIIACGPLVYEAMKAAKELEKEGISARVINNVSIKPMDEATIIAAAKDCACIVTVEEAQAAGGMGSAVCELVASEFPVPVERVGLQDVFGQSGTPTELLEHYKLTAPWIVKAAKHAIKRKRTPR